VGHQSSIASIGLSKTLPDQELDMTPCDLTIGKRPRDRFPKILDPDVAFFFGDTLVQLDTSAIALKQRVLEARIHAAENRMEHLRRNAPGSSPDSQTLDAARLDLLSLYQQLEQSEMDRSLLTITSPADGVISSIEALHPGEVVAEGAAIAPIIPSDRNLIVESWLPTTDRPRIHEGQTARIQPEEALVDPSGAFDGIVLSVSPDVRLIDSRAVYRVVVTPLDEAPPLRLGMTFRIYFIAQQERLLMVLFHRLQAGFSN
jgi:hypothetical protein